MSKLDEKQLEELKRKRKIDEKIAAKYKIPVHRVERDFDPRFVKLILKLLQESNQEEG